MTAIPWTPGLDLACSACAWSAPPSAAAGACPRCDAPLHTRYPDGARWRLPLPEEHLTDLGRAPTPVIGDPGDPDGLLKLESRNPTGSHKDRAHAVLAALARLAGAPGVVTTSTGNHGVSCAAHAAREGLRCVVLSTAALPRPLVAQILAHGGVVGLLEAGERPGLLRRLVAAGWLAATSSDPALSGVATPYGADGYRVLVDELAAILGRLPDAISIPCASGDTLVGVVRGLQDVAERRGDRMPIVLACQPAQAATLRASLETAHPVVLDRPHSVARSTADERIGRLAIALAREHARVVSVSERGILATTVRLARAGLYVETSSALAVAGVELARREGLLPAEATAVSLITAQGRGWNEDEPHIAGGLSPVHDVAGVLAQAGVEDAA